MRSPASPRRRRAERRSVVLAGDVPTGAVRNNFYIEQAEMVRAVGAVSERLHTVNSAREDTLRAVTRALRDRQTVVLSMPLDVQHAPYVSNLPPLDLPPAPGRLYPDPQAVERLADALVRAERPLILGGRGAVISGAEPALIALADRLGALFATSVCGHGLFSGNPWSVGISGGFSSPVADELISESDLNSRLRREFYAMDHQEGQADRAGRRGRAGRYRYVEARLSDAGPACGAWRRADDRGSPIGGARPARREEPAGPEGVAPRPCASAFARATIIIIRIRRKSNEDFIDPRTLSKAVDAILPMDRVVASDSGHFCGWVPRYLRVPNARASCLSHSFQSVGLGLASAIGLAIANPASSPCSAPATAAS